MIQNQPFRLDQSHLQAHLRLMATTDIHLHLQPYDYYADRPAPHLGLARVANLIRQIRAETPNSLLLDNGDFLQGTPLSDLIAERGVDISISGHPAINAMNRLGYDAACLGNHEFNYGLEFLETASRHAAFPMVSCNVARHQGARPTDDITLVPPWVILDRNVMTSQGTLARIKVGVIGFTPPQITKWDHGHLAGALVTRDIIEAAIDHVPALRAAGAEIVVALCHSGIGEVDYRNGMENAAVPLAEIDGIDAVISGHTHLVFPSAQFAAKGPIDPVKGLIHGKPVVMAGSYGSHLGVIDLLVEKHDGEWRPAGEAFATALPVAPAQSGVTDMLQVAADPGIISETARAHVRTLALIRRVIGETAVPLQSYFDLAGPSLCLQIVADAKRRHVTGLLDRKSIGDLPLLVAVAPYRAGGRAGPGNFIDIPAGELTLRNAAELYQHANTCCVIEATGAMIRAWLEKSAGIFHAAKSGAGDQLLLRPEVPSYNFDVLFGLTYEFDLTADPQSGGRLRNLRFEGRPVADDARFAVATNSYRVGGGGDFAMVVDAPVIAETRTLIRDMVINHIRHPAPVQHPHPCGWRLRSTGKDTRMLLESGRGGLAHMAGFRNGPLADAGPGDDGFHLFRLTL